MMQSVRDMRPDKDTSQLSHPLIVKMGGRQWVVGGEYSAPVETEIDAKLVSISTWTPGSPLIQSRPRNRLAVLGAIWYRYLDKLGHVLDYIAAAPIQSLEPRTDSKSSSLSAVWKKPISQAARRIRDTFQVGLTIGLVLGCLSLLVFHQMKPDSGVAAVPSTPPQSPKLASLSPGFTLPSVQLYTLQTGPYDSRNNAEKTVAKLQSQGIPAIVHGESTPTVWCGIAIHPGALNQLEATLNHLHIRVSAHSVSWNATQVPGPSGETKQSAAQVSRWMSASAGSLRTLVAVLSDGGVQKDAERAFQTAEPLYPPQQVVGDTGYDTELRQFWQSLTGGMKDFKAKHGTQSTIQVMLACDTLSRIQVSATHPS